MNDYAHHPAVLDLCNDVKEIHEDLHNIAFFQRGPTVEGNELQVLRRWNSHTPMLQSSYGGGYLLRWRDKGIVIDPGITFLDVFQRAHPVEGMHAHRMDDINLVIVTHDHADHCEDLGMLLVFLRNYNKWLKRSGREHVLDFVQSIGAHLRFVILLHNAENRRYVRAIDAPPPRREPCSHFPLELKPYHLELIEFCAEHTEVLGDRSALGFRMKLQNEDGSEFVYCDTGDTSYNPELSKQYGGADLLLLHVGTMEDVATEPNGHGEHLCFHGIVEILQGLNRSESKPKLVLLGEWGEEFRGPGYRKRFATLAKSVAGYKGPVLPADLGMRIRLDDACHVLCRDGHAERWTLPEDVHVQDYGQWIEYHVQQAAGVAVPGSRLNRRILEPCRATDSTENIEIIS